jgi:hypothetical protein
MASPSNEDLIHPTGDTAVTQHDITELIKSIRGVTEKLLPDVLKETQRSNKLATRNQLILRIIGIFILLVVALMGGAAYSLWALALEVQNTQAEVAGCGDKLDMVGRRSVETNDAVTRVAENSDAVASAKALEPKVELVPELDPVKARQAPLKVRVTQPRVKGLPSVPALKPSANVVVEAPISVKDVQIVPAPSTTPSLSPSSGPAPKETP